MEKIVFLFVIFFSLRDFSLRFGGFFKRMIWLIVVDFDENFWSLRYQIDILPRMIENKFREY
jgi:hypothetical protein